MFRLKMGPKNTLCCSFIITLTTRGGWPSLPPQGGSPVSWIQRPVLPEPDGTWNITNCFISFLLQQSHHCCWHWQNVWWDERPVLSSLPVSGSIGPGDEGTVALPGKTWCCRLSLLYLSHISDRQILTLLSGYHRLAPSSLSNLTKLKFLDSLLQEVFIESEWPCSLLNM